MSDGEDDRVREVYFVGILVDGCCDNGRVDNQRVIGSNGFAAQLHAGVLCRKVHANVFVEDECDPNLTCRRTFGGKCSVLMQSCHLQQESQQ